MNPVIDVNERVDVVVIFYGDKAQRDCVPYKMKYRGREIIFKIFGMRHPTAKGRRMIHVFEMSDGLSDYRLEFDAENLTWTLASMVESL